MLEGAVQRKAHQQVRTMDDPFAVDASEIIFLLGVLITYIYAQYFSLYRIGWPQTS